MKLYLWSDGPQAVVIIDMCGALFMIWSITNCRWYWYVLYCIDRRIYLNLSKSAQSATGLKALKPAANRRYLLCKQLPCYFHLLYRSTFNLLSVKCMLRRIFSCFRNPPNSDMDYRSFSVCTWSLLYVGIHTGGWVHQRQRVSTTYLTRKNSLFFFIVLLTGFEPRSFGSWVTAQMTYLWSAAPPSVVCCCSHQDKFA